MGWDPIGTWFEATFDGNGHTISNLYINRPKPSPLAFSKRIGMMGLYAISDWSMSTLPVKAGRAGRHQHRYNQQQLHHRKRGGNTGQAAWSEVNGSIVGGEYIPATISRSHSSADVSGRNVGGLVGENYGTITFSHATGTVSGAGGGAGGLVERNFNGTIRFSYATGNVSGGNPAGGLAGYNWAGTIISSYATGRVTGDGSGFGGLVGRMFSDETESWLVSSYATGDVTGGIEVGGLIGSLYTRPEAQVVHNVRVVASYSTGRVSGTREVGGLIGLRLRSRDGANRIIVSDSYWDTETSGQTTGVGNGSDTGVQGRTTAQLQSPTGYTGIYGGWDADLDNADGDNNAATGTDDFWHFGTGSQYPALKADLDGDGTPTWQEFGSQRGDFTVPGRAHRLDRHGPGADADRPVVERAE